MFLLGTNVLHLIDVQCNRILLSIKVMKKFFIMLQRGAMKLFSRGSIKKTWTILCCLCGLAGLFQLNNTITSLSEYQHATHFLDGKFVFFHNKTRLTVNFTCSFIENCLLKIYLIIFRVYSHWVDIGANFVMLSYLM